MGENTKATEERPKYVFDPAVQEQLPVVVELLRQIVRWPEETDFLYTVLNYLVTSAPVVRHEDVRAALQRAFPGDSGGHDEYAGRAVD